MSFSIGPTDNNLPVTFIPVSPSTAKKTEGKGTPVDGPTTAQLLGSAAGPSTITLESPSSPPTTDRVQSAGNDLQANPPRENIWVLISEIMILSIKQDNQIEKSSNSQVTSDAIQQIQSSQAAANEDKSAAAWALGLGIAGGLVSVGFSALSIKTSLSSMNLTNEAASTYSEMSPYNENFDPEESSNPVTRGLHDEDLTPEVKQQAENYAIKQSDNLMQRANALNTRGQAFDSLGQALSGLASGIASSKQSDKQAESEELQATATDWQSLSSQLQNFLGAIQQNEQTTESLVQSVLGAQADQKNIAI